MQKISIKSCLGCLAGFFAVSLLLVLAACTAREDTQRLERLLAEADSMNRHYVAFTTDSVMQQAVALADRHGTNTDRVRARYLLGCAYRDMGEAPQALDAFHQAIDVADTTSNDCDFLLLSKIHGQAGDLFFYQGMKRLAMQEYQEGERLAWRAKDTLTAILAYGCLGDCYYELGSYDSMLIVSERTRMVLLERGDTMKGNTFLSQSINSLLSQGRYEEAGPLLHIYESQSEVSDTANYNPNYNMLHYYKGMYAIGTGNLNVARIALERFLSQSTSGNQRRLAYSELFRLYSITNSLDSIKKYAALYQAVSDSIYLYTEKSHLQDIQGLYNYVRHQQLTNVMKEQTMRQQRLITILSFSLIILALTSLHVFIYKRAKVRKQMQEVAANYSSTLYEYHQLKQQLSSAETERDSVQTSYDALRQRYAIVSEALANAQSDSKSPEEWELEDALLDSTVVRKLHFLAASRAMPEDCWFELCELAETAMPNFTEFLREKGLSRQSKEYMVCLLLRMRFALSEIAISLDISSQSLTNIRSRLLKRLFNIKGGAREFDERIRSLPR